MAASKLKPKEQSANRIDEDVFCWKAVKKHPSTQNTSSQKPLSSELWCNDSGCTAHLCKDLTLFTNTHKVNSSLRLANNATSKVTAKGDVQISIADTAMTITQQNTLYVLDLASNLLTVAKIVDTDSTAKLEICFSCVKKFHVPAWSRKRVLM